MSALIAITRKELTSYFVSPLAYVFLSAFLFLSGVFFLLGLTMTGEASLRVMLSNLAVTLVFVIPLLTMQLFAGEKRAGTLEMLLTAPVPLHALVIGKWLAAVILCTLMLAGTVVFPVVLSIYGNPDWGVLFTSYLGLICVVSGFSAAGLFASTLTEDSVAAGMIGIVLLLPFWLFGSFAAITKSTWLRQTLEHAALLPHLKSFSRGILDTADLAYFAVFTVSFLFLTWRAMESRRWR